MVEPLDKLKDCINNKISFIFDAGAGSGKTQSLVDSLNYLINTQGKALELHGQQIGCITYTNVAKDEIISRTNHRNLIYASTIHDFMWKSINKYQEQLKETFVNMMNNRINLKTTELNECSKKAIKKKGNLQERIDKYKSDLDCYLETKQEIKYMNFPNYSKGIVSHDDIINISMLMFSNYNKLTKIMNSLYPYIFIDEYQDTHPEIIKILLEHLGRSSNITIGFFGDKLQQIYSHGVGEISSEYGLEQIIKRDNYRSSIQVINLLNRLRDDITQVQPSCNDKNGITRFYYLNSSEQSDISNIITEHINPNNEFELKILCLTHRYIAEKNGCLKFFTLHSDTRDIIIDNQNNRGFNLWVDCLFDIEDLIYLYDSNMIRELLDTISLKIDSLAMKNRIHETIENLKEMRIESNIKEVVEYAVGSGILGDADSLLSNLHNNENNDDYIEYVRELENIQFTQFISYYNIIQNHSPYSTKHNTKGDEFDNVLVIIDDNTWNQYNFNKYFEGEDTSKSRYQRTRNLFYVICSRAVYNLFILCTSELTENAISQIKEWFGDDYRVI